MANQFNTAVIIADKMLEFMDGLSDILSKVNRDYNSKFEFTPEAHSVGQTIYVEKPPRFTSTSGPEIDSTQTINVPKIPVQINQWRTVAIDLSALDLTFNSNNFNIWAEKWLKPLVSPLVNDAEIAVFRLWSQIANQVGTCGTGFGSTSSTAYDNMAAAREKLSLIGNTPMDNRISYLHPTSARSFGTGISSGFNPQSVIGDAFQSGKPFRTAGFDIFEGNNVDNYTGGSLVTGDNPTTVTTGATMTGINGINLVSLASHTLPVGAVINIAGVYSVKPTAIDQATGLKISTGKLADLVVTQAFTPSTTGTVYVQTPDGKGLIASGPFQNVSNLPGTTKAVTISGVPVSGSTYPMNLAFWHKALGIVTVPIKAPKGLESATRNYKGLSVTISYGPDIFKMRGIWRADFVFGTVVYYPENACRVIGN